MEKYLNTNRILYWIFEETQAQILQSSKWWYDTWSTKNEAKNGQQAIMEILSNYFATQRRKGYNYVRENLVLQPALTTLQVKFSFLSFRPGFIHHIFTYIQIHLIHTKYWKNGHGKLALFCYDEVSLSKLALYYKKFDCILEEWACIEIQIIDKANT